MSRVVIVTSTETMVSQTLNGTLAETFRLQNHAVEIRGSVQFEDCGVSPSIIIFDRLRQNLLRRIRACWPRAIVGLADPKMLTREDRIVARSVDFSLVGSVEHQVAVLGIGGFPILMHWLPQLQPPSSLFKNRSATDRVKLLYHGNRVHLETIPKRALRGLDDLAGNLPLELEMHYRSKKVGRWVPSVKLKNLELRHVEWQEPNVWNAVRGCDIGLVPNLISARPLKSGPIWPQHLGAGPFNKFGKRADDYQLRFKLTSNAGRIYPFGYYGVPVIADFYPSSAEVIRDGLDGFLVIDPLQWAEKVRILAMDSQKRSDMGASLRRRVKDRMDPASNCLFVIRQITEYFRIE